MLRWISAMKRTHFCFSKICDISQQSLNYQRPKKIKISLIVGRNAKFHVSAIMLWVLLSAWNYEVYWEKHEKFISAMYSIGYRISYKVVRMTRIIIRERMDTPAVGSQNANSFLGGRSDGATICLSLRRSAFMQLLLLSPWGPDNQDFNEHGKVKVCSSILLLFRCQE